MERDPVCGQVIRLLEMKESSVYRGSRYYFCCPTCKKLFDEKPEGYADKEELEPPKNNSKQLKLFGDIVK